MSPIPKMITQESYARVTLALDITKKLTEGPFSGYHEMSIIKHQISLNDVISVEDAGTTEIICDNPQVPKDRRNLCWKVAELLKNEFGIKRDVEITIEKNIPVQGGLAGGSANAATVFQLLNELWEIGLSNEQLIDLGRRIGMDVPFYFYGNNAFDTETAGVLESISTDLRFDLVLAIPDVGVSTQEAYQDVDYAKTGKNTNDTAAMKEALEQNNKEYVIRNLHNDFELSVFRKYPLLGKIKEDMLTAGCLNAVMSGSGSTIVGIAGDESYAKEIKERLRYDSLVSKTKAPKL